MQRRRYLASLVGVATVGVAGCNTRSDGGGTDTATPDAAAESPGTTDGGTAPTDGTATTTAPDAGDGETTYTQGDMSEVTARPADETETPTATATPPPADQVIEVGRGEKYFEPNAVTVSAGDTVRWVWVSGGHNIVVEEKPAESDWRGAPDDVYSEGHVHWHTFEVTGTYDYYCLPHRGSGMLGDLVVE